MVNSQVNPFPPSRRDIIANIKFSPIKSYVLIFIVSANNSNEPPRIFIKFLLATNCLCPKLTPAHAHKQSVNKKTE